MTKIESSIELKNKKLEYLHGKYKVDKVKENNKELEVINTKLQEEAMLSFLSALEIYPEILNLVLVKTETSILDDYGNKVNPLEIFIELLKNKSKDEVINDLILQKSSKLIFNIELNLEK